MRESEGRACMFCQNFKGVNSVSLQHTVVPIYPLTVFLSYVLEDKYADFQRKISTVTNCGITQTTYKIYRISL